MLPVKQCKESAVTKRIICDYVSYVGEIQNVELTNKKLILAAAAACQKYSAYLSQNSKESSNNQKG